MQLIRLDIQNFLSIERASLDFTPGMHYIAGKNWDMGADEDESNGAGKSSLFEAIQWCLFGTTARGNLGADGVVNNAIGKDCRVMLTFEHAGRNYVVLRTRKDEEYGNGLQYWIDGAPQTQHRDRDTKADLVEDLPITERIFRHAVQVGQEMPDRFLALSEPDKHDLICQIANISVFDIAQARAKDNLKKVEIESKVFAGTIQNLQQQRLGLASDLEVQEDALRMESQSQGPDLSEVKKVEEHLATQIAKLDEEMSSIRDEIERVNAERHAQAESITQLSETVANAKVETEARRGDVEKRYNDLMALKGQVDRLDGEMQEVSENPEKCVLCKKDPGFNAAAECQNLREHLAELQAERDRVFALYNERLTEYSPLQETYQQWAAYRDQVQEQLDTAQQGINAKSNHTATLAQQCEMKRQQQEKFRTDKEALTNRIQLQEQKLAGLRAKIEQIQDSIGKIDAQIAEKEQLVEEKQKSARHWKYWVVSIPNLRAAAISKLLEYVNSRIEHYMQVMSGGAMGTELYQKAHGQGSKIQVSLRTPGGSYVASSGGERRRVNLAVFLALFDFLQMSSGTKFNVLVCDEIMDGLSPAGVRKLTGAFRDKANEGMAIYVISHNPAVQQVCQFDTTRTIEKRGGRSVLDEAKELTHV